MELAQWKKLQDKLAADAAKHSAEAVFSPAVFGVNAPDGTHSSRGTCYLYGLNIGSSRANDSEPHDEVSADLWRAQLAALATAPSAVDSLDQAVSEADRDLFNKQATSWLATTPNKNIELSIAVEAVLWASAMVPLSRILPQETWWQLLSHLQQYRADAALDAETRSATHLLLAGELGITLAWRLGGLPSCTRTCQASLDAVAAFLEGEADSIDCVLQQPSDLRMVVASLVRCECLFPVVSKRKFKKRHREIAAEFATWMAALLRQDGSQVLTTNPPSESKHDVAPPKGSKKNTRKKSNKKKAKHKKNTVALANNSRELLSGLMHAASHFDADTLVPAIAASLGQSHSGGRLAWEVSLPEAMWHSDQGKLVAMLPEWDVRRGRSFIDYSGEDMRIEIAGGRSLVLSGTHQTLVQVDGKIAEPKGSWEVTCEYTDDDVHMIEMEQPFTMDVVLQRQWMVVREDRCVMVSDAVLSAKKNTNGETNAGVPAIFSGEVPDDAPELTCVSRLPLAEGIEVTEDDETREILLSSKSKRRCKVLPLAASEWRVGPSACKVSISDDRHLVVETKGTGAIYSPIWLDFQTRRFQRPSTWRTLTVADNLTLLPKNVAAGFRIQAGSEHWVLYRSLSGRVPRSFMGKHLIADFFAARFHPSDGGMEELVTVDDNRSE